MTHAPFDPKPDLQAYLANHVVVQGEGVNDAIALRDFERKLVTSLKDLPAGYIAMWRACPEFSSYRDFASPVPVYHIKGRWFPAPIGHPIRDTALYVTVHFPYWSQTHAD